MKLAASGEKKLTRNDSDDAGIDLCNRDGDPEPFNRSSSNEEKPARKRPRSRLLR